MTFYVDLDLLKLVVQPGYTSPPSGIAFRRSDKLSIVVQFVQNGLLVDPTDALALNVYFAVKADGNYSQNPGLVIAGPLTKSGTGTATAFTAVVDFGTMEMNTAFSLAENIRALNAMVEIKWTNAATTLVGTTSRQACTVENEVYALPGGNVPVQRSAIWLPGVTALTGGGAANLDGLVTATIAVPQSFVLSINASSQIWVLMAGTETEDSAGGIVRGDDFNISTNAKVFKRVG